MLKINSFVKRDRYLILPKDKAMIPIGQTFNIGNEICHIWVSYKLSNTYKKDAAL